MSLYLPLVHDPDFQATFTHEVYCKDQKLNDLILYQSTQEDDKDFCLNTFYRIPLTEVLDKLEKDYRLYGTHIVYLPSGLVSSDISYSKAALPMLSLATMNLVISHVIDGSGNHTPESLKKLGKDTCRHLVLYTGHVDPFEWVDPAKIECITCDIEMGEMESLSQYFKGKEGQFTSLNTIVANNFSQASQMLELCGETSISTLCSKQKLHNTSYTLEGLDIDTLQVPTAIDVEALKAARIGQIRKSLSMSLVGNTHYVIKCSASNQVDQDFFMDKIDLRPYENRKVININYRLTIQTSPTESVDIDFTLVLRPSKKERKSGRSAPKQ